MSAQPVVTLPPSFAATRYPGYFWNVSEQRLYSLKSGTLKPIQALRNGPWFRNRGVYFRPGYVVSHGGKKRLVPIAELQAIVLHHHVIPAELPQNTGC